MDTRLGAPIVSGAVGPRTPFSLAPSALAAIETLLRNVAHKSDRELIFAATHAVTELVGERGSCVLFDSATSGRVVLSTHTPALSNWPVQLDRYPELCLARDQRAIVVVEDAGVDERLDGVRTMLPTGLRGVVVVPIYTDTECVGALLLQSTTPARPTESALATCALVGGVLAALLVRGRGLFPIEADLRPAPPSVARVKGEKGNVLVLEDDDAQALGIADILSMEGYGVVVVPDGEQAVAEARAHVPDLVLTDVHVPKLDGFGVAAELARRTATSDVPVLFLSGYDDLMTRVRGFDANELDFLAKPYSAEELLVRVERAISRGRKQRNLRSQAHLDIL